MATLARTAGLRLTATEWDVIEALAFVKPPRSSVPVVITELLSQGRHIPELRDQMDWDEPPRGSRRRLIPLELKEDTWAWLQIIAPKRHTSLSRVATVVLIAQIKRQLTDPEVQHLLERRQSRQPRL